VHNLLGGPGNPDGIDYPLAPDLKNNFSAYWRPFDAWSLMPTGMIRASVHGVLTDVVDQILGSTTINKLGLLKEIFADYSPELSQSRRVEVLSNNIVVFTASLSGASGFVASVSDWPIGCGMTTFGTNGPLLCFWWRFWPQAQFMINNQSVLGDEIRILAGDGPHPLAHLTQFSLRAAGFDELILAGDDSEHIGPITTKEQRFGDILTTSWVPPNMRQALQTADKVTGPWVDVPGVIVPPFIASPTGSNNFFRVRAKFVGGPP
jgi:hypothetical protein